MAWFLPSLRPCDNPNMCTKPRKIHEVVFFLAIYLISVGTGGHKPSLESFGADQFDDNHEEERRQKMSFFNWWSCSLCNGLIVGVTLIVYIQDNINSGVDDIIFTGVMAFSLLIFIVGRPFYRYLAPIGSSLTPTLHVLVAAISKRNLPYPSDSAQLYEIPESHCNGRFLCHTNKIKLWTCKFFLHLVLLKSLWFQVVLALPTSMSPSWKRWTSRRGFEATDSWCVKRGHGELLGSVTPIQAPATWS